MKTLILMRHAKSSWTAQGPDETRPLNARGEAAAPVMARWMAARGLRPDAILCSSATRTRQTVALMREAVPDWPEPVILPALYLAEPDEILAALRGLPDRVSTGLVVGHEPGLSTAARLLGGRAVPDHFPTAAAAVFEISARGWGGLSWGKAKFVDFAKPRDLMAP